jgi:replicative DNA helicase
MNPMPCSKEAETALIGSVLINPACFKEIDLSDDDFYFGQSKETWKIYKELTYEKKVIDHLTVLQRATEKGLQSTLNMSYLLDAQSNTPTSLNFETYADIVKDKAKRREFIRISETMATSAYDEKQPIDEKIPVILNNIINSSRPDKTMEHISIPLSDLYDEIEKNVENPKDIWGMSSGIPGYDKITGGFQKGEVTMITGEPGTGKSLLCVQFCFHMAKEKHGGAIFEMEMKNRQTLLRQLSSESGVEAYKMKSGQLSDDEYPKITYGIEKMESMPVYISDATSWTTSSMRAELIRLKMQYKIEWFLLDYLMLLKDRYGSNENERQNFISIAVKDLCKDLDLAGIVINSVNKQSQASGSKQIQHDFDNNIKMEKKENGNIVTYDLIWEKQREGVGNQRFINLSKKDGFPQFAETMSSYKPSYVK